MNACHSCNSPINQNDHVCWHCGAVLLPSRPSHPSPPRNVQSGRNLVIIAACLTIGYVVIQALFGLLVNNLIGTPPTPGCLGDVVRSVPTFILLYLVFLGYAWARWLMVFFSLAGAIYGFINLPQTSEIGFPVILLMSVMASAVVILLLVPSVGTFQRFQRESYAAKRNR